MLTESAQRLELLQKIKDQLKNKPRDLLLFDFLTQTKLPVIALMKMKRVDIENIQPGERLVMGTEKEEGTRNYFIPETLHESLKRFLEEERPSTDDYLFSSRKGKGPLTLQSVSRMVRGWFSQIGVERAGGIRFLRKQSAGHHEYYPKSNTKEAVPAVPILKPVHVITAQEQVLNELENAILSGRIAPGERLLPEDIACQMNVSRMPVREAIGRLEARGLIHTQRKGFHIVSGLSKSNLEEISEIRLMLEPAAARFAALLSSDAAVGELSSIFRKLVQANARYEVDEILRLNKEFHFTIYRESAKPMLHQLIGIMWEKISPYFHIMMRNLKEYDQTFDSELHAKMLEAMEKRDPEEVCRWVKRDIQHAAKSVMSFFDRPLRADA